MKYFDSSRECKYSSTNPSLGLIVGEIIRELIAFAVLWAMPSIGGKSQSCSLHEAVLASEK